jgi:GntR family transcriptional regulator
MRFHVRPASALPLYRQLVQQVERLAAAGQLREGDALPSVRDLARDLGVNPATIVKAYAELEQTGLVETRRGLGTFLAKTGVGLQRAQRLRRLRNSADALMVEAHQLGLDESDVHESISEAAARLRAAQERSER